MITTAVLALLADLAVSGFVKTVYMQSRCKFGGGLRIDQTPAQYPSNVGTPALWATNAQSASYYNGGYMGIYHKVSLRNRHLVLTNIIRPTIHPTSPPSLKTSRPTGRVLKARSSLTKSLNGKTSPLPVTL
jgi:hypothetical protein